MPDGLARMISSRRSWPTTGTHPSCRTTSLREGGVGRVREEQHAAVDDE